MVEGVRINLMQGMEPEQKEEEVHTQAAVPACGFGDCAKYRGHLYKRTAQDRMLDSSCDVPALALSVYSICLLKFCSTIGSHSSPSKVLPGQL